ERPEPVEPVAPPSPWSPEGSSSWGDEAAVPHLPPPSSSVPPPSSSVPPPPTSSLPPTGPVPPPMGATEGDGVIATESPAVADPGRKRSKLVVAGAVAAVGALG